MAIEFDCPSCGVMIRVGEKAIGKKGRCPKCQTLLLVPDPDDFEEDDEEEEPAPEAAEHVVEPESELEPEPEPAFEPAATAESPLIADNPLDPPEFATPAESDAALTESSPPAGVDPDNPFAFAAAAPNVSRVASYRHRSRRKSAMSSRQILSISAAVFGLAILLLGGWLLYAMVSPDLTGDLTGERFKDVDLPSVSFAAPEKETSAVMDVLENEGLPLTSEYISVLLDANTGKPRVTVEPGPQAIPVRVAVGEHAGVQAVLAREREHITKLKQFELRTATADLFRDYAAYLDDGTAMSKLPDYRDKVALNAAIGPVGFAIEAVISGHPFPCVYEDTEGHCYFFLPEGLRTFQLRGRKLADGSTPLPVEFEVTLVDAKTPVIAEAKPSKADDAESKPEEPKSDNGEDVPKDEPKPGSMKSEESDKQPADE
ncbi:MAG: hypothetical protein WBC44_00520 [Planctomycetaceae bacterium]